MSEQLSGRDLDAAVAERVMGWQWMKRVKENVAWLFPPDSEDRDTGEKGIFGEPVIVRNHVVGPFEPYDGKARKQGMSHSPRYSESIEAAMEVAEKMRERGFQFDLTDKFAIDDRLWWAEFATPDGVNGGQHFATTPSEAICHAALEGMRQLTAHNAEVERRREQG